LLGDLKVAVTANFARKFGITDNLENRPGKKTTNLLEQAVGKTALRDVTVRAVVAALVFERGALDFGIDDEAQAGVRAAKRLRCLKAVEARHTEIEQGQIGFMLRGELNGVDAVAGGADYLEAAGKIQIVADGTQSGGGIIGYENADWVDVRHCSSIVKARSYWRTWRGKGIGGIA
jgi:hypothetical protein